MVIFHSYVKLPEGTVSLSQTDSDSTNQCGIEVDWDGLGPIHVNINLPMSLASSPILTSPIFANVENALGGEANVTDANSIPGSTRQHTNPIKSCLTHLALSDSLMHCNIHQRRTFWGWRLCTAARISGVGIISCQRHYSITMGHSAGSESLMISHYGPYIDLT